MELKLGNECNKSTTQHQTPSVKKLSKSLLATAIGLIVAGAPLANAETFTVLNADDDGEGSLRQAIESANENPGLDQVVFDASLNGTTVVVGSALEVSDALELTGLGSDSTTIVNNYSTTVFDIIDFDGDVEISKITVETASGTLNRQRLIRSSVSLSLVDVQLVNKGGLAETGAVSSSGNTTIDSSIIDGFTLPSGFGGDLAIMSSVVRNTIVSATSYGGAITHSGTDLTIERSLFENNRADYKGWANGGLGGAIYKTSNGRIEISDSSFVNNFGSNIINFNGEVAISRCVFRSNDGPILGTRNPLGSRVEIDSSLVADNSKGFIAYWQGDTNRQLDISNVSFIDNNGGALALRISDGSDQVRIENSTFSGNTASGFGGAINIFRANGLDADIVSANITLANVTLVDNDAPYGKAIYIDSTIAGVTAINSVFASSIETGGSDIVYGPLNIDHSLVGTSENGVLTEITPGSSLFDTNPMLGALADNGGVRVGFGSDVSISTHAVQIDSPLIDAGDSSADGVPDYDQRGEGFERILGDAVDIGAVEYRNEAPALSAPLDAVEVTVDTPFSVDLGVSYSDQEGDSLTFKLVELSDTFQLTAAGYFLGEFDALAMAGVGFPLEVEYEVTDGINPVAGTITLIHNNLPPALVSSLNYSVEVNKAVNYELVQMVSDPEQEVLVFTSGALITGFSLSEAGMFTGTLAPSEVGSLPAEIPFTVSDSVNNVNFTLQLTLNNQAPVIVNIPAIQVSSGDSVNVSLAQYVSDPEEQALSYSSSALPEGLSLSAGGDVTGVITDAALNLLPATITISISDGENKVDANVDLSVRPAPTPEPSPEPTITPTASPSVVTTTEASENSMAPVVSSNGGGGAFGLGWLLLLMLSSLVSLKGSVVNSMRWLFAWPKR